MIPDTFLISDSSLPQGQYISLLNLSCGIGILSSAGSLSLSTARRCTRKLEISSMDFSGSSRCSISSVSTATYSPPSTSSYSGVSKRNSSGPFCRTLEGTGRSVEYLAIVKITMSHQNTALHLFRNTFRLLYNCKKANQHNIL